MQQILFYGLLIYLFSLASLALFISKNSRSEQDFLVGGRSFNLWLTTFCLFATWFGAGTLISATDEVAKQGLWVTALEPYGAGLCLIFTGLFFAKPLWEMKLMTYGDFLNRKFGTRAERLSVLLNIPIYVGWIAVQLVALSQVLAVFFPVPAWQFMIFIAALCCFLTVMGGIWSVSITDSFQLVIILVGLTYLLYKVVGGSMSQLQNLLAMVPTSNKQMVPVGHWRETFNWLGLLSVSALGNMTGQDLGQRLFSAKSAQVAQRGCLLAGAGYIIFGSIPVFLGLTASSTLGSYQGSVIPNLIDHFLDPMTAAILVITITSAVISTITSALLAPSSLLAHNYLSKKWTDISSLRLCQASVVVIATLSLLTAFAGEDIYQLLENSYAIGLVAFFVPITIGLYSKKLDEKACLITMSFGVAIWLPEYFGYENLPYSLLAVALGYPIYFISYRWLRALSQD